MTESKELTVKFRHELDTLKPQFQAALPAHVTPERFVRIVMTAVNMDPKLLAAERRSLLAACMKAAQDGLLPDGREAAFVIFNTKGRNGGWEQRVQYMPMVAGVLKKVRNSGELASITANVVYEKDHFTYQLGDEERIEHTPTIGDDRGRPIAAYAVATLKSGEKVREVMTFREIEQVRGVSKAKDNGPWVEWWGEMARKTVIRRLSKRLPMSSDLEQVIRRDDDLYDLSARVPQGASRTAQVLSLLTGTATEPAPDAPSQASDEDRDDERPARRRRKPDQGQPSNPPFDPDTGEIIDGGDGQDDLPL